MAGFGDRRCCFGRDLPGLTIVAQCGDIALQIGSIEGRPDGLNPRHRFGSGVTVVVADS